MSGKESGTMIKAIETEGLTKYYGKARGIVDLSLSVEQGEFFGFIGQNGAGKSTTIRILLGLIRAGSGAARVLGFDPVHQRQNILRQVGYLPSEAVFYPGMRVRDVIRLSADLRKTDCAAEAARLCERLELDTGKRMEELSFGNRKKVAIVCALQHCPPLCILDEPTGGLDPLMQREFFRLLRERNRQGTTIFLSSHILSEIQRNCTRAAIIRQGSIVACDSVENLAKTNAKRVTVHGGDFDPDGLERVRDISRSADGVSFLYGGDINQLLGALAAHRITDLTVSEPDLEEIFMHYYEGGEHGDTVEA